MNADKKNISIYGVGNFGYAILKHFDKKKNGVINITAYDHNKDLVKHLKENREHPFFHRGVKISKKVRFVNGTKELMESCNVLVLAVTSDATREVIKDIKPYISKGLIIVNTAKALDYKTSERLSEIINDLLKGKEYSYGLIAGGTIARDLFHHEPLGVDLASKNKETLRVLEGLFSSDNLYVYPTTDLAGVEYASAFKNIISILAGLVNGLGFSYGSETHVISRTASSIAEVLVDKHKAKKSTFDMGGQCWGNDLWMSCTGKTRNREFGRLVGKTGNVDKAIDIMKKEHKTVEGLNTLKILDKIESVRDIEIIELLYKLVVKKAIEVSDMKEYILKIGLAK